METPQNGIRKRDEMALLDIIYEDLELLVLHKPADLVCHPTKGDEYSSLISRARIYLHSHASDQERIAPLPYLIHRLDRETSGLVLMAKNAVAARELGKIWESRGVRKEYLAIVHGWVKSDHGLIDAPLGRDETSRVAIKDCVRPDGHPAQTAYFVEKRFARIVKTQSPCGASDTSRFSVLRLEPRTGRKHQIRIHLAHLGHPIVGDKLYGGDPDLYLALVERRLTPEQRARLILPQHALHASRLQFEWRGRNWEFTAPPAPALAGFISAATHT